MPSLSSLCERNRRIPTGLRGGHSVKVCDEGGSCARVSLGGRVDRAGVNGLPPRPSDAGRAAV